MTDGSKNSKKQEPHLRNLIIYINFHSTQIYSSEYVEQSEFHSFIDDIIQLAEMTNIKISNIEQEALANSIKKVIAKMDIMSELENLSKSLESALSLIDHQFDSHILNGIRIEIRNAMKQGSETKSLVKQN